MKAKLESHFANHHTQETLNYGFCIAFGILGKNVIGDYVAY